MTVSTFRRALVGTVVAFVAFGATGAQAATANATAKAQILRPITLTKTADLDFGTIITGTLPSTVQVSTLGVRTCGTGLVCSNTVTAAAFTISGTTGSVVTIVAAGPVTLSSGTNTMVATLNSSAATRTLTGTDAFTVGGTLAVGANQADGAYTGTFTATVDYQ